MGAGHEEAGEAGEEEAGEAGEVGDLGGRGRVNATHAQPTRHDRVLMHAAVGGDARAFGMHVTCVQHTRAPVWQGAGCCTRSKGRTAWVNVMCGVRGVGEGERVSEGSLLDGRQ